MKSPDSSDPQERRAVCPGVWRRRCSRSRLVAAVLVPVVVAFVASCASPVEEPGELSTSQAGQVRGEVPASEELAAALLIEDDLERPVPVGDIDPREGVAVAGRFRLVANGRPGVIPEDQRDTMKPIERVGLVCDSAARLWAPIGA